MKTYGYARVSTESQKLARQEHNILTAFPGATLYEDKWTGTTTERENWRRLLRIVKPGDRIVFDSVSRMARNAEDGVRQYMELFTKGVELVFLNEPMINTESYREALAGAKIDRTEDEDLNGLLEALERYIRKLAEKQIRIAFEQAEKEATDIRERVRQGLERRRADGKPMGGQTTEGKPRHTPEADAARAVILQHSKAFGGSLSDKDCITLAGCSRPTFYKYKAQLLAELEAQA